MPHSAAPKFLNFFWYHNTNSKTLVPHTEVEAMYGAATVKQHSGAPFKSDFLSMPEPNFFKEDVY